jgi:hypothetical protein
MKLDELILEIDGFTDLIGNEAIVNVCLRLNRFETNDPELKTSLARFKNLTKEGQIKYVSVILSVHSGVGQSLMTFVEETMAVCVPASLATPTKMEMVKPPFRKPSHSPFRKPLISTLKNKNRMHLPTHTRSSPM